jgi:hypothetical protein
METGEKGLLKGAQIVCWIDWEVNGRFLAPA